MLWIAMGFAVFVLSVHITVPGVNIEVWNRLLERGELFKFLGMFTGGALNNFAITAMGITPYINASIIMQLLTVVIPKLHELQKEGGDQGRRKLGQYVRSLTIILAFLQAGMMTLSLARYQGAGGSIFILPESVILQYLYYATVILSLVAGTAFLMWLGEIMTDKGIGNGVSLIIFAGIVLRMPNYLINTFKVAQVTGTGYYIGLAIFFLITLGLIMGIIMLTQGQRKVPVQYAKRVVGRKVFGGHSTYIPIRVNNAGVISIIFAISIMYLPSTLTGFINPEQSPQWLLTFKGFIDNIFSPQHVVYNLMYFLLVVFFTYFYSAITFNISDVADNMKKYGGFIPGIRPGRPTAEYLEKILGRITFISALCLGLIAVLPTYAMQLTNVKTFYLGSTSMLIIVGVALDLMQQIEARMVMRHYQGFMK
jgi:preprotein translocase subunit SecY